MNQSRRESRRRPLSPADLEHIRRWSNEPVNITGIRKADLSAALAYLPPEKREEADESIREALRLYLTNATYDHEPRPAMLASYFATVETRSRDLAGLLLYRGDLEPERWDTPGTALDHVVARLWVRRQPNLPNVEVTRLLALLARLCEVAGEVAKDNEAKAIAGRPWENRADLIELLRPLWEMATNRQAFVVACLAAIGQEENEEAVRKAIERSGHNSAERAVLCPD